METGRKLLQGDTKYENKTNLKHPCYLTHDGRNKWGLGGSWRDALLNKTDKNVGGRVYPISGEQNQEESDGWNSKTSCASLSLTEHGL